MNTMLSQSVFKVAEIEDTTPDFAQEEKGEPRSLMEAFERATSTGVSSGLVLPYDASEEPVLTPSPPAPSSPVEAKSPSAAAELPAAELPATEPLVSLLAATAAAPPSPSSSSPVMTRARRRVAALELESPPATSRALVPAAAPLLPLKTGYSMEVMVKAGFSFLCFLCVQEQRH